MAARLWLPTFSVENGRRGRTGGDRAVVSSLRRDGQGTLMTTITAAQPPLLLRGPDRLTPMMMTPGALSFPISFSSCYSCASATAMTRIGTATLIKAKSAVDDDDLGDHELNDAIKKGRNILAEQKDILQQIIERRAILSSENVINNGTEAASSHCAGNIELVDFDVVMTTNNIHQKSNKQKNSCIYTQSDTIPEKEKQFCSSPGDHNVKEKILLQKAKVGTSAADVHDSATTKEKIVPTFPPVAARLSESQEEHPSELLEEDTDVTAPESPNADPGEGKENYPLAGSNVMNVIYVAAECAPWSKTGGLGDVAGALPKALAKRGHRVMVVVPRYGSYSKLHEIGNRKRFKVGGQDMEVAYFHAYIDGVDFVFIDSPIFRHCEKNIYGGERQEILKRMVLLSKSAVEACWHVPCGGVCYGDGNLVFIANDWHTALLPVYLKAYYRDSDLMKYSRSILVIHNIAHQGRGPMDDFALIDLPEHYCDIFKIDDPIGGEHFNVFAAGLKTADQIVTVSHGYAWELKTSEGGWGLHEIINDNGWKFQGIVNGIDTNDWNPELDVHLKADSYINYTLDTLKTGKSQCKAALQKELGLSVCGNIPFIGFIGRLDHQKGIDLIAEAIPWMVSQDMQLVMLGSGRADLEEMLRKFERQHFNKVRGWVGFSVKAAHRITAGVDILLMPSRFEPCGLNQLYAMKYGTIPIVHAVGGLRDTVIPFDPFKETGFGWTFDRAEPHMLINALGHCLDTYWNYKSSWEGLQRRGMMQDLSWEKAAEHYEKVLVKAKYQW